MNRCEPRWATARDESLPTNGDKLAKVANLMGFELFDWQRRVVDTALEKQDGHYVFRTVGASVGRQGGKSKLIEVRIAFELLQPRKQIAYTAQDRAMAKLKWLEHVQSFERTPQIARQIHNSSHVVSSDLCFGCNTRISRRCHSRSLLIWAYFDFYRITSQAPHRCFN